MNRHYLLVVIFLNLLVTAGFTQTNTIQVAGVQRNFILHMPGSAISNAPLVFLLHGLGETGAGIQSTSQMDKIADRENFIVVYPNAINKTWDYASTKNDFKFLLAIIDTLDSKYRIDKNRIYIAGFSQGGGMTVYAGFQYPDVFAAIAPVSSIGSGAPAPKHPIPIFLTFGTKDIYPPATFMSAVNTWLKINDCTSAAVITRPFPVSNQKSVVTRISYVPCAQGTEIIVDSISGGTHEWPMNTTTKVNNSEEVWAFFKKFSLKNNTAIQYKTIPVSYNCISVSYSSGIVHLQGAEEKSRVRVIDTEGRLVTSLILAKSQFVFKDKPSGVYIVMVSEKNRHNSIRMAIP